MRGMEVSGVGTICDDILPNRFEVIDIFLFGFTCATARPTKYAGGFDTEIKCPFEPTVAIEQGLVENIFVGQLLHAGYYTVCGDRCIRKFDR